MPVDIIHCEKRILHGFSGHAADKDYGKAGFALGDRMWKIVKSNKLANDGINYWVYDGDDKMFVGTVLTSTFQGNEGQELEVREVPGGQFARWIHIGSYHGLKSAYAEMKREMQTRNILYHFPMIEVYGHWTPNEMELRTEILSSI